MVCKSWESIPSIEVFNVFTLPFKYKSFFDKIVFSGIVIGFA